MTIGYFPFFVLLIRAQRTESAPATFSFERWSEGILSTCGHSLSAGDIPTLWWSVYFIIFSLVLFGCARGRTHVVAVLLLIMETK